ncbi:hypothetical protein MBLNU230_g1534t1 [Neophaeotheca triangularis]
MLDLNTSNYNQFADSNNNNKQQHFNNTAAGNSFDPTFTTDFSSQASYPLDPSFDAFQGQQLGQQQHLSQGTDIPNQSFYQPQGVSPHFSNIGFDFNHGSNNVSPHALSQNTSPTDSAAVEGFPSFDTTQGFDQNGSLDPTLLGLDPNSLDLQNFHSNASLNPMATTMQHQSITPPHLLPDMARRQSNSPSPNVSPNFAQNGFQPSMNNRPRNISDSLDPSSAWNTQGQNNDWLGMGGYRQNRTPSDQYSEASHSNQASPYMPTYDSFDHSSPLMNPQEDPIFADALGMGNFSLNDQQQTMQQQQQQQPQQTFHSPGNSPGHSPGLMPQSQHILPPFTAENNYGLQSTMSSQYQQPQYSQPNPLELFPGYESEAVFPPMSQGTSPGAVGEANAMSPPEINIDFAPETKAHAGNTKASNDIPEDTLSPPARSPSRNRMRSKSDTAAASRPRSPSIGRGRAPSLQTHNSATLSPFDANAASSRSSSPASGARGRKVSLSSRSARSTSNASDRDKILGLADPERTPSTTGDGGSRHRSATQKHPATFQCTLCPKRFTRAYNLRSHLRTHTDERPFVCTVCGKAFARQHDRKRHEGLHSGEKRFVCRGTLKSGPQWGCGRRFARADALGRHFRSEAGRVCIKPLLDEEAAERHGQWVEEQQQQQHNLQQPQAQQPLDMMSSAFLPAALLQQYPDLAGIDWNNLPPASSSATGSGAQDDDYDYLSGGNGNGGRSSFDAGTSSPGEYYDEVSENEMGGNGGYGSQQPPGMGIGTNQMGNMAGMPGFPPARGRRQQAGDFMEGFEGR